MCRAAWATTRRSSTPTGMFPTADCRFQRHKLALWSIYNLELGRFGDVSVSGLWRVDSGETFSLRATGQPLSDIQTALLSRRLSGRAVRADDLLRRTRHGAVQGLRRRRRRPGIQRAGLQDAPAVGQVRHLQRVEQSEADRVEHDGGSGSIQRHRRFGLATGYTRAQLREGDLESHTSRTRSRETATLPSPAGRT